MKKSCGAEPEVHRRQVLQGFGLSIECIWMLCLQPTLDACFPLRSYGQGCGQAYQGYGGYAGAAYGAPDQTYGNAYGPGYGGTGYGGGQGGQGGCGYSYGPSGYGQGAFACCHIHITSFGELMQTQVPNLQAQVMATMLVATTEPRRHHEASEHAQAAMLKVRSGLQDAAATAVVRATSVQQGCPAPSRRPYCRHRDA